MSDLDFSLPLKNPVVIFSLVLFIILFAPILLNRLKIPHIIGLILAGIIIGPYGFNLLLRDSSIVLFGTVGLLYIMFTAGLEIDLEEFRINRVKSLVFGLYTFVFPMIFGTITGYFLLGFSLPSSILLAAMFASHTLLAYPIAGKYGIARIRSVTLTIGGTIITDILALLVLAAVTGMVKGEIGVSFWVRLAISTVIFGLVIFLLYPVIARWFFKKFDDHISQYIFVLAMVFLGAFLAEVAGLEAIVGAFLAGLALNKFIPHSSALMNRIDFVGNAFFIPFFLISVGMLVDFRVLFNGWNALLIALVMTVLAILTKFIAAWVTQKTYRLTADERRMIFGLSTARVGATLAVVLVGYNLIIGETAAGEPIRLLNEDVLNGAILMILVTCTVSSFVVEKASRALALSEDNQDAIMDSPDKILVSLAYPDTVTELVDLGLMLKGGASLTPMYALTVVSDEDENGASSASSKKMMQLAIHHAAASSNTITPLVRHDMNIGNGIIYSIREQQITDVVIGFHHNASQEDFLGKTTAEILKRVAETVFIYKSSQPFNTIRKMIIAVTPQAELEPGFSHWFKKLCSISRATGISMEFYATDETIGELNDLRQLLASKPAMKFFPFSNWDDFLAFTGRVKKDDMLVIISSRPDHVSFHAQLKKLPYFLTNYFLENNFIIVYPRQLQHGLRMDDIQHAEGPIAETFSGTAAIARKAGKFFGKYFNKKAQD